MKIAVITGSTGFIGSHLTLKLLKEGYEVYALIREGSSFKMELSHYRGLNVIKGDIKNVEIILEHINTCDVFFHLAWEGVNRKNIDNIQVHEQNVLYSMKCIEVALKLNCKCFIHTGSSAEYGIGQNGMFKESQKVKPISAYAKSKWLFYCKASKLCLNTEMRFLHVRIFSVYGINDHPWSLVYTTISRLLKNEDVRLGKCIHYWNYIYIDDLVEGIIALYDNSYKIPKNDSGIFNIASNDTRVLKNFVEEIHRITCSQGKLQFGAIEQTSKEAISMQPNINKIGIITEWKSKISFEEGIKT